MCYRALHDLPRARETWEQVVKAHPRTDAATQARALLASISGGRPAR
jgi:TolA-binding protein